jgi:hypothetical protein
MIKCRELNAENHTTLESEDNETVNVLWEVIIEDFVEAISMIVQRLLQLLRTC